MPKPIIKVVNKISVREFFEKDKQVLDLEVVAGADGMERMIGERSINRPALALTGYYKFFANKRIQLFGAGEMAYLRDQEATRQEAILTEFLSHNVPCIIISRGLLPTRAMRQACETAKVPLLRTNHKSKDFSAEATLLLETLFAPRTTLHGTFLDVRGIGCLLQGASGVGKSECALALIERGHSLVADDLVYAKQMGEHDIIGTSPELNRGYMECRGIGIINIAELFGIRSVRLEKRIDLVISFVEWQPGMPEERTGLERNTMRILDADIPLVEIPVKPGRDMARLTEVAAMVQALKQMGHNTAEVFNERLIAHMSQG